MVDDEVLRFAADFTGGLRPPGTPHWGVPPQTPRRGMGIELFFFGVRVWWVRSGAGMGDGFGVVVWVVWVGAGNILGKSGARLVVFGV